MSRLEKEVIAVKVGLIFCSRETSGMIAMNCPNCAAPINFGMSACGYCGSGLMRKVGGGVIRFAIPNDAKEMKFGDDFPDWMRLAEIVESMKKKIGQNDYAYIIWRDVPVLVGPGIDVDEALRNFKTSMTQKDREQLGEKWTRAVQLFGQFLRRVNELSHDTRLTLGKRYFDGWRKDSRLPSMEFFQRPSFENIEELMNYMPGDDADSLTKTIDEISKFL